MKKVIVSGGAGFIGSNLVDRLVGKANEVVVIDDLSKAGATTNLAWLRAKHGSDAFRFFQEDVADFAPVSGALKDADIVFHLAGQVAVTTSISNPRADFVSNALGSLNMLEAARLYGNDPLFVLSSTNKVYGSLANLNIIEDPSRYRLADYPNGIPEAHPLDFHSPYGCSKGTADCYTRDYARTYNLRSVIVRQSCIYGPHQHGNEEQGWLAWFTRAARDGRPLTIYGDGKQVRDVLHIDDLLDLYESIVRHRATVAGHVFNIGGGPANTISIWHELAPMLEELLGRKPEVRYREARQGDQKVFISDITKARRELGWQPHVSVAAGLAKLCEHLDSEPTPTSGNGVRAVGP
ncbi:GDP-mannose 4,6-dehydratase [Pseudomonas sp.]|uniref:GDP-mannose 4,6-dehydratase n=1 Tax=Pseudomonas sp. TaxID=306 RepID=UPI00272AFA46|nr:GDP-mannose 4,6-dehydratase [Pseudomonas sp.]